MDSHWNIYILVHFIIGIDQISHSKQPLQNLCCHRDVILSLLLLLLLLKKVGSARLRESVEHPISPKTPAPQYQPIDRKKRKGKRVEDYSRDRAS